MTKEYYQKNRLIILKKVEEREKENKKSLNYVKLTNHRKYRSRLKDIIKYHEEKIKEAKNKIKLVNQIIACLELEWGKERSLRKRGNLVAKESNNTKSMGT